jgi:hypothetical protein
MGPVEIVSVTRADDAGGELLGFELEAPVQGRGDEPVVPVRGWVLGAASPAASVEITQGRQVLWQQPLSPRGDVSRMHRDVPPGTRAGFDAALGVLGLEEDFELTVSAVLEDGSRVALATVRGRRERLSPPPPGSLRPVRVTCLHRSGSTWLMHLLATHPEIVAVRAYPYESAAARYWAHALKVLTEPAAPDVGPRASEPRRVGHNPYYKDAVRAEPGLARWYAREYVEDLVSLCRRSAESWYRLVAEGQGKDRVSFFAEKHILQPGEAREVWNELYPGGSEVLLVRDFRDVVFSGISFDRSHGHRRFGDRPGEPYEPYIRRVLARAERLCEIWPGRGDVHLVRYEDLIAEPRETLAALLAHIGVAASTETVAGVLQEAREPIAGGRRHVTAPSVEESVGRWRAEADDSFRALCDELLGQPLRAFGYA